LRIEVESGGKHEELHADSVVGADGAASRVARASGWPAIETVPLVQAIVPCRKIAHRIRPASGSCRMIRPIFTG